MLSLPLPAYHISSPYIVPHYSAKRCMQSRIDGLVADGYGDFQLSAFTELRSTGNLTAMFLGND